MKTALREFAASGTELHASMKIDASGSGVHLGKHGNIQLRDAAGWTVRALGGTVWITQDEDVRDVVLEAGESFVIDRDGVTLLYALDDARICVARKAEHPAAAKSADKAARSARRWPAVSALFA